MRRFLTISFIVLALTVSAAGVAPAAHAQTTPLSPPSQDSTQVAAEVTEWKADPKAAEAAARLAAEQNRSDNATWGRNWIMAAIVQLFAWLVGVAALALNFAAHYTVVDMGRYINGLSSIGIVWKILRDIGNILLIFGFLAVGISIIIDSGWYGGGQKLLPTLLIAAVFTNFSLFAAEAVIDVSNLFATQIYTQINGGAILTDSDPNKFSDIIKNKGIAGTLMSRLGLQGIYNEAKKTGSDGKPMLSGDSPWYTGFMSIILFIVVAFVMFALAFILIARFVILLFLIILSPIGIAGLAVPHLVGYAHAWWHNLFRQAITAPVLFLLLYIALRVITDTTEGGGFFGFGTKEFAWGGIGTGNYIGFAATLLSYLIAVGLLLAVVIVAKSLSAFGGSWATKTAGAASFGVTGWAMNRTFGRGAHRASNRLRSNETFNKINAMTGRVMTRTLDRAANGSWDMRGTGALKNVPGGIDAGTQTKGGFVGARDRSIKDHEEEAKRIDKAIEERGANKKEEEAIAAAEKELATAKEARKTAEKEHEDAKKKWDPEVERLKAEVKRLEEEKKTDKYWITNPANERQLEAAKQSLTTTQKSLKDATDAFKSAGDAVKIAEGKEAEENKSSRDRIAGDKKASKLAYAEGISHPGIGYPLTFVTYGPASKAAANKIKASLKDQSTEKKALEAVKKLVEEEKQKGGKPEKEEGEEEKEVKKPEAEK